MSEQMPAVVGEIKPVAVGQLFESPWNPRQYYPAGPMLELVESMKSAGFRSWLPIMARPRAEGGFEIAAGHRRTRAAREAGIAAIPCIIRDMDDVEFLDILNFDNCGREDVHPLHEAAGWTAWMEKTGGDVSDIAAKIGQSREYVYQRLKYSALNSESRAAFLNGDITAGHAILIARLQPADQLRALKFCEPKSWSPDTKPSVRELAAFIQRDVHLDLTQANFDLDDAALFPAAGPCATCPKRTSNAPDLQAPLTDFGVNADSTSGDDCTDPACFNEKLSLHILQVKQQLAAAAKPVIEVSGSWGKAKKGILSPNTFDRVPEDAPDAEAALVVDGHCAGQLIHIRRHKASSASEPDSDNAQERRRLEEEEESQRKAKFEMELAVRVATLNAIRNKVSGLLRADLVALLSELITENDIEGADVLCRVRGISLPADATSWDFSEALGKALPKMTEMELFRLAVELPVSKDLEGYSIRRGDDPEQLRALAKRYKVDVAKIRRQIEEPAKEAEGGTRREVKAPGAGKAAAKKPSSKAKPSPAKKTGKAKAAVVKQPAKADPETQPVN